MGGGRRGQGIASADRTFFFFLSLFMEILIAWCTLYPSLGMYVCMHVVSICVMMYVMMRYVCSDHDVGVYYSRAVREKKNSDNGIQARRTNRGREKEEP